MAEERAPAVAGRFYPGTTESCRAAADEALAVNVSERARGAIVPHAGWIYSGPTAGKALRAIAASEPATVVIFGAVHGPDPNPASVYASGSWKTPVGVSEIDETLAAAFLESDLIVADTNAHQFEHAIEVQVPLIQRLMPTVKIVPVSVQPTAQAVAVGRHCGEVVRALGMAAAFVGSTDLTHYGPAFGFEPHGHGEAGVRWAKEVNDRRLIDLIAKMDGEAVISEAILNRSACGAGAVAATIGAMQALGAERYVELEHTTSSEIAARHGDPDRFNSVGYEAGVFV